MTIHLWSKDEVEVSKMFKKISLKNTWGRESKRITAISNQFDGRQISYIVYNMLHEPEKKLKSATNLDLHFEMFPEVLQEGEEKGERKLENLGNSGNAIFRESHAKILLDGADEHVVRLK